MRPGSKAVAVVFTLALALTCGACGGTKQAAQAPEANPWSDYKGTFAAGVPETTPESKPASTSETKPASTAESKPRLTAATKPKSTAPSQASAVEAKPAAPANDAKAMYDMTGEAKPDEAASAPTPKKAPKKRGGKKSGGKKAPGPRVKR